MVTATSARPMLPPSPLAPGVAAVVVVVEGSFGDVSGFGHEVRCDHRTADHRLVRGDGQRPSTDGSLSCISPAGPLGLFEVAAGTVLFGRDLAASSRGGVGYDDFEILALRAARRS